MEGGAVSASHRHPAVLPRRSRGAVGDPAPRGAHRHAGFPAFRPSAPGRDAAQDGGGGLGCVLRLVRSPAAPSFPARLAARVVRVLVLSLLLAAGTAAAQYPARPIRLLVPNPPGGATDTLARVLAPKLGEALGQPVIVDNRPGSNGIVATDMAAKAAPDGHTLLLAADAQIVIGPHLYPRMPVDTLKDLAPVASLVNTQMVLAVHPSLPVSNFQEFIEYARRANPPLAYGSIGNGSQHHLVMEMLKSRANIELLHVPFKGGGPATMALIAGEISAMFGGN